ncbi:RICIN domain-containing protein [Deinococcus sp.]|uniref:RICIN domain-containing protein n=1 Tax=Deinococcus sp. TaxID=47478 RepID=UPI003B5B9770
MYLTTPDRSQLLAKQPDLTFSGSASGGATINVDASQTFQSMDGFGASITDSSAALLYQLAPAQRDQVMQKVFDPNAGIGMSFLRQPIGSSDFVDGPHYTFDDIPANETDFNMSRFTVAHDNARILPLLRQALTLNPQLKVMLTSWGQPAWMKENGQQFGGKLKNDSRVISAYALYLVKSIQAYEAAGVPVYGLTVQNEPQNVSPDGYPGTDMPVATEAAVINALGPMLQNAGLGRVKIIGFDHNWQLFPGDPSNEPNYPYDLLRTSAAQYIAGTGYHCYAGDASAQSRLHDTFPNKDIWFTECSGFRGFADSQAKAFADTLNFHAKNITIGTTRNWAKAVVNWNLALDNNGKPNNGGCGRSPDGVCTGAIGINGNNVQYNAEYYNLGHMSKFVKVGAVHIGSNNIGDVTDVAFKNPDGSVVLVAHNSGGGQQTFNVAYNNTYLNYTLPAGGLATFIWNGIGGNNGGNTNGDVTLYTDCFFTGKSAGLSVGNYTLNDLTALGIPNDTVSSIRVKAGFKIEIFVDDGYQGQSLSLTSDNNCLTNNNFNDKLSSVRVTRTDGNNGGTTGPIDTSRFYQVVNQNSGKCLDDADFGTLNGAVLQQWPCSSPASANQLWQFRPTLDGYYQVVTKQASLVWDVAGGPNATGNGTAAQLWTYVGATNQQWRPVSLGGGVYQFVARHSGKCLDVKDVSTSDGARLQQWECTGGPAQQFKLR